MSFSWAEHAECLAGYYSGEGETSKHCNADRAAMVAEGKRLEAERDQAVADLKAYLEDTAVTCAYCHARHERPVTFEDIQAHVSVCHKHPMAVVKAENARISCLVSDLSFKLGQRDAEVARLREALECILDRHAYATSPICECKACLTARAALSGEE